MPIPVPKSLKAGNPPRTPEEKSEPTEIRELILDSPIEDIDDLISMLDKHPLRYDFKYAVDQILHTVSAELEKLRRMVGTSSLKKNIVDQILFMRNV